ncbi:MAG: hypothetical protein AAF703_08370 [Cyanobacteria bacterium P01_D01_bin.105]
MAAPHRRSALANPVLVAIPEHCKATRALPLHRRGTVRDGGAVCVLDEIEALGGVEMLEQQR